MNSVNLYGVSNMPFIIEGDDISLILINSLKKECFELLDGDIIVIAQKIISKSEGAVVELSTITPSEQAIQLAKQTGRDPSLCQLYIDESSKILFVKGRMIITQHKLGFKMASAGVDLSNIAPYEEKKAVLLPKDSDKSARLIRKRIKELTGKKVAVIINDSLGKDDRGGSIGMAIGIAGINHLEFRMQKDLFGNESKSSIALIDELAAAASILMGQANESVPIVIIRGVSYTTKEYATIKDILE